MTWVLAGALALAACSFASAICVRADQRVLQLLGGPSPGRGERMVRMSDPRFLALGGLVLGGSAALASSPTAVLTAPVLALAGYRLPSFIAARERNARQIDMAATVPDLLDIVAVSVTAGLSPRLALDRSSEAVVGPIAVELAAIRHEVSMGGTWRSGLRDAADRLGLPELRRLAVVIEQGQRLGTPVSDRLRSLAREVRAERRARREERARRAPVVMLFPLVFLILPAFVLAAVVPALLVAIRGVP
ncbi:MAG TPA: type II secretion system F family protein [Actinomycetota bacterium]|nr:type II secretion system F family protein [Actinomycetota bacterium]